MFSDSVSASCSRSNKKETLEILSRVSDNLSVKLESYSRHANAILSRSRNNLQALQKKAEKTMAEYSTAASALENQVSCQHTEAGKTRDTAQIQPSVQPVEYITVESQPGYFEPLVQTPPVTAPSTDTQENLAAVFTAAKEAFDQIQDLCKQQIPTFKSVQDSIENSLNKNP